MLALGLCVAIVVMVVDDGSNQWRTKGEAREVERKIIKMIFHLFIIFYNSIVRGKEFKSWMYLLNTSISVS